MKLDHMNYNQNYMNTFIKPHLVRFGSPYKGLP